MACSNFSGSMSLTNNGINITGSAVIKGFSSNLGIGSSDSSIDIDLVADQCNGFDPGSITIGQPATFTCGGFSFGGFVDKIEFSQSESGTGWKVRLGDPKRFLDNVKVLLDGFYCNILMDNFINVQYLLEGSSVGFGICSPGGIPNPDINLPSVGYCGSYGYGKLGAGRTAYLQALMAIQQSPALVAPDGSSIGCSLSPIIAIASAIPWAGTDSPSMSLLQLITATCDEAGYDFIATMNNGMISFITIDRSISTNLNSLPNIIQGFSDNGILLSSSYGKEVSYQTTKRIVIGDNIQYLKQIPQISPNNIGMITGYDNYGNPITASLLQVTSGYFPINTSTLALALAGYVSSIQNVENITEAEILAATAEDSSFWLAYCTQNPASIGYQVGNQLFGSIWSNAVSAITTGLQQLVQRNEQNAQGLIFDKGISQLNNKAHPVFVQIMEIVRNWIRNWANEYYGVQWLVTIPGNICWKGYAVGSYVGGTSQATLVSDEISDAAWCHQPSVLGLIKGLETSLFQTDDGRIKPFVTVPISTGRTLYVGGYPAVFALDPSKISSQYYIKGNLAYIPVDIENKIVQTSGLGLIVKTPQIGLSYRPTSSPANAVEGINVLALLTSGISPVPSNTGATQKSTHAPNIFKIGTAIQSFASICIPFKSNMYVYGPWVGGIDTGGADVIINRDLNPWTYGGSYETMKIVGQALASDGLSTQTKSESGSIVVAGNPTYSLGPINSLILNSVTVNTGSSGVTTTYNFQTFTQKFGNYAQNFDERLKQSISTKKEIYNIIRANRQKNFAEINAARTSIYQARLKASNNNFIVSNNNPPSKSKSSSTPVEYLIGSYPYSYNYSFPPTGGAGGGTSGVDTQSQLECDELDSPPQPYYQSSSTGGSITQSISASVGLDKIYAGTHYADADNYVSYAITSLDALLSPVSIYGSGKLPRFAQTTSSYNLMAFKNKPRPVMPPISIDGNLTGQMIIDGYFLNPMTSAGALGSWSTRSNGSSMGFSLKTITYGTLPETLFNTNEIAETDFRFNALKGPLVLQAWGYDTEGKPIPNAVDGPNNCANGMFQRTGLQDKFMGNWLADPRVWPVGPIDLRWDRDRNVWVSPPSEKLVIAQLIDDLDKHSSAQAILLNPSTPAGHFYQDHEVYGPEGEHITGNIGGSRITVADFLGRKLCKGTVIYAYHYGSGKYLALETSIVDDPMCSICNSSDSSSSGSSTSDSSGSSTSASSGSSDSASSGSSASDGSASDECDACGLLSCFEAINGGPLSPSLSGVLGIASGCLTIYPLVTCGTEETTPIP